MIHELKIQPPFFDHLLEGKPFEVRRNDRGYQKGDTLFLREWVPREGMGTFDRYTGRTTERVVNFVYNSGFGCHMGEFVVLGLDPLP